MASCKSETQAYRQCLKDARSSGGGTKKCHSLAQTLEACREKWRAANDVKHEFDGTRILPNHKCQPLNAKMQQCLKWKQSDQSQCQPEIGALKTCMQQTEGILAAPTQGDKVWSDYKKDRK